MTLLQISEPGEAAAPHPRKRAIGIDLGMTNSLVATVRHGLAIVQQHCTSVDTQVGAFQALAFKRAMLWALIDTIHNAYRD